MPVTCRVAHLGIRSRRLISGTRFDAQAGIPYSRYVRTEAPYKKIKADFGRSWKERLTMKINRLALFAASVHSAEGENIVLV